MVGQKPAIHTIVVCLRISRQNKIGLESTCIPMFSDLLYLCCTKIKKCVRKHPIYRTYYKDFCKYYVICRFLIFQFEHQHLLKVLLLKISSIPRNMFYNKCPLKKQKYFHQKKVFLLNSHQL